MFVLVAIFLWHGYCYLKKYLVMILQAVLITSNGAWKLGGFGFATSTNQPVSDIANVQTFHYAVSIVYYLYRT